MKINCHRLQREIDALGLISENPAPVVTRIIFSEVDLRARVFVKNLCREAGLTIREDAVGNIFARWNGTEKELPAVATGSHIDAIPNAGKYDGVVGVLGGIEAIRSLKESGFRPKHSIELIVFTSEEPTRFGIGCLGSRLMSGVLRADKAAKLSDPDGKTLEHWRRQGGCNGTLKSVRMRKNFYSAFVELHIEQGPILESEKIAAGIVEKIAAPATLRLLLTGVGGHAGATLMPGRRDALLAGAEIALAVETAATESGSADTVGTTGLFKIEPGAVNSVPYKALLEIDVRDTDRKSRDAVLGQIEREARKICGRRKIGLKMQRLNADPPAVCSPVLVDMAVETCQAQNISCKKMISRAYHDTLFMARICPTTMILIPCRKGYSHRPDEYSSRAQNERGVRVLAGMLAKAAG